MFWDDLKVNDVVFSREPKISPSYDKKKPHKLDKTVLVKVILSDNNLLNFVVPGGFLFNGANVVHKDRLLYAALVHDWLCENHKDCDNNRYLCTLIFVKLAEKAGCGAFVRWWLKHSVDNYQKVCGGW